MKTLVINLFLLFPLLVMAQTKQKAEREFVAELNSIIKNSTQQHWAYEGQKMTIDSPYAINKNGILSVTVSYIDADGKKTISRMEAPVKQIKNVAYDLYVILEFKDEVVRNFYAENGNTILKASEIDDYFHIGNSLPEDGYDAESLRKLLSNLMKYYGK